MAFLSGVVRYAKGSLSTAWRTTTFPPGCRAYFNDAFVGLAELRKTIRRCCVGLHVCRISYHTITSHGDTSKTYCMCPPHECKSFTPSDTPPHLSSGVDILSHAWTKSGIPLGYLTCHQCCSHIERLGKVLCFIF